MGKESLPLVETAPPTITPGIKTSEFWFSVITVVGVIIAGLLQTPYADPSQFPISGTIILAIAAVLANFSYNIGRSFVKAAQINNH